MAILREHLVEKAPVSEVCEKHGVQPTLFYTWHRRSCSRRARRFLSSREPSPLAR